MNAKISFAALCLAAMACDSTGPGGSGGNVAIKFESGTGPQVSANLLTTGDATVARDLTVTGTNGTLVLQDIRFIVEEMKLRSTETTNTCGEADDAEGHDSGDDNIQVSLDKGSAHDSARENENDDDCEVKGGPFIVDLPLNSTNTTTVSTENVPAGTYDRFMFKVDDLEGGHDDEADDSANTSALLDQIRTVYPNFPARASMVVKGTQDGTPFTVYFRSKLHITQAISPPLTVPGSGTMTVTIDPSMWFKNGNQILNLLALNGQLVDLGGNFKNAIRGAHRGDH